MDTIVIIAGETSGDLIGKEIVEQLSKRYPDLQFCGIAGPAMRKAGVLPWFRTESFNVMGIVDVLKKAFFLLFALRKTIRFILKSGSKAVILIDQPSFSTACAKRLRARGYTGKIIQVVAPTVWAYKPERAETLAKYIDIVLLLYRFELDYFIKKMPCVWVGHPLVSLIHTTSNESKTILALFPGSRPGEIKRNLPLQLEAAALILKEFPELQVCISLGEIIPPHLFQFISKLASKTVKKFTFTPFKDRYTLMRKARAAFSKSGTVTLELALFKVPFVCCYKVGFITELYAKYILGLKERSFALPNILTNTKTFPECIIPPVTPQAMQKALVPFLTGEKSLPDLLSIIEQIDPGESPGKKMATAIAETIGYCHES